jgi:hypothetical protein
MLLISGGLLGSGELVVANVLLVYDVLLAASVLRKHIVQDERVICWGRYWRREVLR